MGKPLYFMPLSFVKSRIAKNPDSGSKFSGKSIMGIPFKASFALESPKISVTVFMILALKIGLTESIPVTRALSKLNLYK